jgi:hypothetical protein
MTFRLRNVPLLSRVGADRADGLRTDVDAAIAGWNDALLLRVDDRNQVLFTGERVVLGPAAAFADTPPADAVFLGRIADGRHVWAVRAALEAPPQESHDALAARAIGLKMLAPVVDLVPPGVHQAAVQDLKADLAKLREELPTHYVSKEDFNDRWNEVLKALHRIEDKLDKKVDR